MEEELRAKKRLRKEKGDGFDFDFDRVLNEEGNEAALRNLRVVDGEENLHSVSISCDSVVDFEKGYRARAGEVKVDVCKGSGENAEVENRSGKRSKLHIEDESKNVVENVKRKLLADKLRGSDRVLRSRSAVKIECSSVADSEENNSNMTVQNCSSIYGENLVKVERVSDDGLLSADQKVKRKRGRPRKVKTEDEEVVVSPIEKLKRKRGRPPKLKVEDNHQVCEVNKLKRKRGRPRKTEKVNDNSLPVQGGLNIMIPKRGRGRPRKLQQSNEALKDEHAEERKVKLATKISMKLRKSVRNIGLDNRISAAKKLIRKVIRMKRAPPAENEISKEYLEPEEALTTSSKVTCGDNMKEVKKVEKSKIKVDECSKSAAKNLVRDRITEILITAGWTVQYRPRFKKVYNDAVYVSPEGRTHWSITLAYNVLKKHYEVGDGDSKVYKTGFIFTPIPEEDIMTLTRVRREGKKKKNGILKIKALIEKAKARSPVSKSVQRKRKKNVSHHELDNSDHKLVKKFPSSLRKKNRKQCALLVRNTEESANSSNDGYLLHNGKRTLLGWMIDSGILSLDEKVQYMNRRKSRAKFEGRLTKDGIHCNCCDDVITISTFEMHAGSKLGQPLENICVQNGSSLLQCLLESWNKQNEPQCKGYNFVNVDVEDPNDDTCGICGDGGDLICCDSCPSTFHQSCLDIKKFPSGPWHCLYCSCKSCGQITTDLHPREDGHETDAAVFSKCHLCEKKYHPICVQTNDASGDDVNNLVFCGKKCQVLHERLQKLLGVKHDMEEGFSWTLIRRSDLGSDVSLCSEVAQKVQCNSKLAVALLVMDECFLPIIDHRSGINLIQNILYNCGSNFTRLNFNGFYTAILEKGDEMICAASLRIHGTELAEMPFIGTRYMYRRQGMCRRFLNVIESALSSLDVEKLVLPAISEVKDTWTSVFGFKPLEETSKQRMRNMSLLVFPGVEMLQKPLLKDRLRIEHTPLADGSESPQLAVQQKSEAVATPPEDTHSPEPCLSSCSKRTAHDGFGLSSEPAVVETSIKPNDKISNDDKDNTTNDDKARNEDVIDNVVERNQNFENSLCSTCPCEEAKQAGQCQTTSPDLEDQTSKLNGRLDVNSAIDQKSSLECPEGTASFDSQENAEVGIPDDKIKSTHDVHVNQSDTISSCDPQETASVRDEQTTLFDSEVVNGCHATSQMDDKTSSPSKGDKLNEHTASTIVSSLCHPKDDAVVRR